MRTRGLIIATLSLGLTGAGTATLLARSAPDAQQRAEATAPSHSVAAPAAAGAHDRLSVAPGNESARAAMPTLSDLLLPRRAPDGYVRNPEVTGPFGIERAAAYLFGDPDEQGWLREHLFAEALERTYVQRSAPYRIIATTVYRFGDPAAPTALQQIPGPTERVFPVPDFHGFITHGTDASIPTSDRLGRDVPDFVVRLDIGSLLFLIEVAGPATTEDDAIDLARRQAERAKRLLGL